MWLYKTVSFISNELSTQTVILALLGNKITFSVLSKENNVHYRQRKIDGASAHKGSVAVLLETTTKDTGAGVGARWENRSLDEPTDDTDEVTHTSQCTMDLLQPLQLFSPLQIYVKVTN